jgi:hypothetical protein
MRASNYVPATLRTVAALMSLGLARRGPRGIGAVSEPRTSLSASQLLQGRTTCAGRGVGGVAWHCCCFCPPGVPARRKRWASLGGQSARQHAAMSLRREGHCFRQRCSAALRVLGWQKTAVSQAAGWTAYINGARSGASANVIICMKVHGSDSWSDCRSGTRQN